MHTMPYIVGLTGQTGAGKSTVSGRLAKHGFHIIDCDPVAHEVMEREDSCQLLAGEFGPEILTEDGHLNRKALSKLVFSDPKKLETLNRLIHPPILKRIFELIRQVSAPIVLLDAPTLIESGLSENCDTVISVTAEPVIRKLRIVHRDKLDLASAERRIHAQNDETFYSKHSHYVLMNNGTKFDLLTKADHLAKYLQEKITRDRQTM